MLYIFSICRNGFCKVAALLLLTVALSACAKPPVGHPPEEAYDPYEQTNRSIHAFNKTIDRNLIRPVGVTYSGFLPDDLETPLARLASNLSIPTDIVNNILQLDMVSATENLYRFTVNSTVGILGLFDPATGLGMPDRASTNFGATLHTWGVREGAYIELPFVGPSTQRDTAGFFIDLALNPLNYVLNDPWNYISLIARGADTLARRGRFADTVDSVLYESVDSYSAQKTLYIQARRFELDGGADSGFEDPYDDFGPPLDDAIE